MTIQNMRYIIEVAKHNSISKAALSLYMTQSALSTAIRETEEELGIRIFRRTNRGVMLTEDGEDCLQNCREIVEKTERFKARYKNRDTTNTSFSVSAQHLPFAVRAFGELLKNDTADRYNVGIYETDTTAVIQDVASGKSDMGILAITRNQQMLLEKTFREDGLFFSVFASVRPYVFFRREHPLAGESGLTLEKLRQYPYVTYDRDSDSIFYTEETILHEPWSCCIHVSDRATKMAIIRSSDAFCIGIDLPNFNRDIYFRNRSTELVAIPFLDQKEDIQIGCLEKLGLMRSDIANDYLKLLEIHLQQLSLPGT